MFQSSLSHRTISQLSRNQGDWFTVRREFFIRRVFEEFFSLQEDFQKMYLAFLSAPHLFQINQHGRPKFEGMATPNNEKRFKPLHRADFQVNSVDGHIRKSRKEVYGIIQRIIGSETNKGALWLLKDLCHRIWPRTGDLAEEGGLLVDWLIGSLFHEAMKFKENVYILNSYVDSKSKIQHRKNRPGIRESGLVSRNEFLGCAMGTRHLLKRISVDTEKQLELMLDLCGRITYMLRIIMSSLTNNVLVIRLLLEQEEKVRDLWGESVEEVFEDIFPGGAEEGFCITGRSYFEGQWYHRALNAYRCALLINTNCDEAIIKISHLEAILES